MPVNPGDDITRGSLRITIKVDGTAINASYGIYSITVHHAINQISYAEVGLVGEDPAESDIPSIDGTTFIPGTPITISIAYDDNAEVSIFTGLIVQQGLELNEYNPLKLNLLCKQRRRIS